VSDLKIMAGLQNLDKQAVRRAFDAAARNYDAHAVLQAEVSRRLLEKLDILKLQPRRFLDAGCGTGAALAGLRARYPKAESYALDLAPAMVQAARGRDAGWRNWLGGLTGLTGPARHYLCGDLERLPLATSSVDLLWSSLALQWMNDPEIAIREWYRVIAPEGLLIFTTFGPDTLRELRTAFAQVDGREHTSRFVDMHDLGDMLVNAGFATPVMEMETYTLTYATLAAALHDLKAIGAHHVAADRARGLFTKSAWQRLVAAYEGFRRDGRLPVSFEVVIGHAWVNQKTRLEDGRQIVQWNIQDRRRKHGLG
jgi:malonyl-CoA O-methyltransferase